MGAVNCYLSNSDSGNKYIVRLKTRIIELLQLIVEYILVTYRWTPLQSNATNTLATGAPYLRYGHTVVAYRGKAYLWGGRNDEKGASAVLHQFDPGIFTYLTRILLAYP